MWDNTEQDSAGFAENGGMKILAYTLTALFLAVVIFDVLYFFEVLK